MFRVICPACGNPAEPGELCKCGNLVAERMASPLEGSYVQIVTPSGGMMYKTIPSHKANALSRTHNRNCFCVSGD